MPLLRKILLAVMLLVVVFLLAMLSHPLSPAVNNNSGLPMSTLSIGAETLSVEIAATPKARAQGLSGRASLKSGTGMFFVFQQNGDWGFWMKDMQFPIDIIFIGETGAVTTVYKNISPDTYPQVFYPEVASRFVLEVPAGFAETHQITQGSTFIVPSDVRVLGEVTP